MLFSQYLCCPDEVRHGEVQIERAGREHRRLAIVIRTHGQHLNARNQQQNNQKMAIQVRLEAKGD